MNGHDILIVIAILCELVGVGWGWWDARYSHSAIALGLVFYLVSLLVR